MDRAAASDEAQRWLGTAEKLLSARDLLGAKSFAIRVREAFPALESAAHDVLTVADTLLAGEIRFNGHRDWYAVLGLPRYTHSMDVIADRYRRLALVLNPLSNRLPLSHEAFRLVSEAWSVLSNPSKKVFYDNEFNMFNRYDFGAGSVQVTGAGTELQEHQFLHRNQHFFNQNQSNQILTPTPTPTLAPFQSPAPEPHLHLQTRHESQLFQQPQHTPPPAPAPEPQLHEQIRHKSRQVPQPQAIPTPAPEPEPQLHAQTQGEAQQVQQQQQPRKSPRKKGGTAMVEEERPNLNNVAESGPSAQITESYPERTRPPTRHEGPSFWTACPYCFVLYEYPKAYKEFVLRCQRCERGFQASPIPAPPISDDDEAYFCCWGYFPLRLSEKIGKSRDGAEPWTPFSPMFACPKPGEAMKVAGDTTGKRKETAQRTRPASPRYIYRDDDDDDEIMDISDESDDAELSDESDDWRGDSPKKSSKKARASKDTRSAAKTAAKTAPAPTPERVTRARLSQAVNNSGGGKKTDEAAPARGPAKAKGVASGGKKKGAAEWGKLDLNVEFSNDADEPPPAKAAPPGMNRGNAGDEENIEGNEFFEGLDEFLSSLPILNVVAEDKVKATQ